MSQDDRHEAEAQVTVRWLRLNQYVLREYVNRAHASDVGLFSQAWVMLDELAAIYAAAGNADGAAYVTELARLLESKYVAARKASS